MRNACQRVRELVAKRKSVDEARDRYNVNMLSNNRALVLRVNELFHDLEGEQYADVHPEIFEREKRRWERNVNDVIGVLPLPRTALDVGAGTGFVGSILRSHLSKGDTMICADISQEMLRCCEKEFSNASEGFALKTIKMEDETIALPDQSADLITLNSVLHHIPDSEKFLRELARILKPGGILIIGHEPNARFYRNTFLVVLGRIAHHLTPKRLAALILKGLGLYDRVVKPQSRVNPVLTKMNETLMKEKLIDHPLSQPEVSALIDVHSPTAWGLHREKGFDPVHLFDQLPTMELIGLETYGYLPKYSGSLAGGYERILHLLAPRSGGTFFLKARKMGVTA